MNSNLKIDQIERGKINVDNKTFKDVKIYNDKVFEWNWNKTKTVHDPGIQIMDLIDFISEIDYLVLSTGFENKLKIKQETIRYIEYKKKVFYILRTDEAVNKYNELVSQGKSVGALIHSTC